ncbi:unnamed protein product [Schistosoma curassoni]|uniref:Uncharacterized protein n=1 Tax=Schistosoma curassoni TaxID=6186 RepID=A0A183L3S8_9TREM|nr:unnamed protein product [Schistosoma curassoni]
MLFAKWCFNKFILWNRINPFSFKICIQCPLRIITI